MKFSKKKLTGAILLALMTSTASNVALAQKTTSSIKGNIVDQVGAAIQEASVEIIHEPTGRSTTLNVDSSGRFLANGLRPGGPYTIVVKASSFQEEKFENIRLALDDVLSISIDLEKVNSNPIEVITVKATPSSFKTVGSKLGSAFGLEDIGNLPTVSRDTKDIVRLDPRAVVTDGNQGQLSIAGINQRFNSVTIDGIRLNDDFGLNRSGNPGRANPVSIDAIEQIVVNIADYDVEASQYLGGNTNIITKSGTNEFKGSAYVFAKNDSYAGEFPDGTEPTIDEKTYGVTLGGPIIKDRLFFFANYEEFDTDSPVGSTPQNANITGDEIARYQDILQRVYNFDGGTAQLNNTDEDERILLKLDGYINDDHRAVLTYTKDEATTVTQQESNVSNFALSSTYLTQVREVTGYSAHIFSDWTDYFSTDVTYSYKKSIEDRNPANSDFAQFLVRTNSGSFLHAGPRFPFQQNFQKNTYETFKIKGTYFLDEHVIKGGYEYQETSIQNDFVLFAPNGYYVFNSFEDLEARTASAFMYENAPSGNAEDAGARWSYNVHNFFLSDSWDLNDEVTLDYGVRVERYEASTRPGENPGFVSRNQFSNTANLDGKSLVMPRVGLTWEPNERTRVRAGAGIFSGGTPNVFYSNTFNRNGVSTASVGVFRQPCTNLSASDAAAICQNVDGFNVAPEAQALVRANVGSATAEALDPNFDIPSSWKFSAGVEYELDLTSWGLGDGWFTKTDALLFKTIDGLSVDVLGLERTGTTFDGRPTFRSDTIDYLLTNTDEGRSLSLSTAFEKKFDNGIGIMAGYTYTDAEDADSTQGSVLSDFTRLVAPDPNNLGATTSSLEVKNRFIFSLNYEYDWGNEFVTQIGLFGEHRDGLPFSYTFANNPFGSRTSAPFYVPLANDPNVNYDGNTRALLDAFIAENGLEGYRGQVLARNAFKGKNVTKVDLRIVQKIPGFFEGSKGEIIFEIDNFTNLLNDDWGIERSVNSNGAFAASGIPLASVAYDATNNTYTYSGTPGLPVGDDRRIVNNNSIWSAQIGVRFTF